MIDIFLIIQIIISIFLILSIILQRDSTDSLTGLSGSSTNAPLNVRTTEGLLVKITKYLGLFFFINCLILGNLAVREGKKSSILDKVESIVNQKKSIPTGE